MVNGNKGKGAIMRIKMHVFDAILPMNPPSPLKYGVKCLGKNRGKLNLCLAPNRLER